jgi:PilZ domain
LEKRIHERQQVSLSVEILDPPHLGKVSLVTRDISKDGAFILLARDKCPSVGRIVSLRISGILWGEKLSTVSARVVRVIDEGMGLQFLDFDFM